MKELSVLSFIFSQIFQSRASSRVALCRERVTNFLTLNLGHENGMFSFLDRSDSMVLNLTFKAFTI